MIFLSEYHIRRTTFINNILNMNHSHGNLCSKIVPNFWQLSIKQYYKITKKILLGCSLKCKILLIFNCTTKKFHDRHRTNRQHHYNWAKNGVGFARCRAHFMSLWFRNLIKHECLNYHLKGNFKPLFSKFWLTNRSSLEKLPVLWFDKFLLFSIIVFKSYQNSQLGIP